ncbi:MAG: GNAT family N-acetyltransferase [Gomphosphaeria aponina SAG 52.96 = DSM 107014]|uniref:GNAT family N-acetyltransferase n=1 Tax=Gomphosphaeria aponina SAG 52.96 = DSM 107014 TaxID=1521640 RepID=A0A941GRS5_9CHRO|nr:GNAT family N-acetyltransferase [Gomphosphaeria aponina SAG 52.96 = DSM 107014]
MNKVEIKLVKYSEYFTQINSIRIAVFQEEQGVPAALEFDGKDATAQHLLAYLNGKPVGTSRIRKLDENVVKIERLAVIPTARGKGIANQLMATALELISSQNYSQVMIHSQEYIKRLYEKLGFEQVGNPFEEAGIPHVKMIKFLGN